MPPMAHMGPECWAGNDSTRKEENSAGQDAQSGSVCLSTSQSLDLAVSLHF